MKTEIRIFQNEQFGKVRIAMNDNNEPLFCLADVCSILGLRQGDVRQRLDEGVVSTQPLETAGGIQQANFVNEDGLYDTILDSRKPEAKQFRKWVTSEVLPSIRKHGVYFTPEKIEEVLNDPDTIIRLATTLKEEKQKRAEAEKHVMILTHTNKTYTATEIAKEIGMKSANELNKWLEKKKVQYKVNGTWVPCSGYSDRAWFEIKQEELDNGHIIYHRKITGIGRDGILSLCKRI